MIGTFQVRVEVPDDIVRQLPDERQLVSPRSAGSWNVPNRTKDGDTRHTTAPGSYAAFPLHKASLTYSEMSLQTSTSSPYAPFTFSLLSLRYRRRSIANRRLPEWQCRERHTALLHQKSGLQVYIGLEQGTSVIRGRSGATKVIYGRQLLRRERTCRTCRAAPCRRCPRARGRVWWGCPSRTWPRWQ